MSERAKNITVLVLILLLSGLVYLWFYTLNKGVVKITAAHVPYFIIEEDNQTLCETNPCELTLKSGAHYLQIRKDGYISENINIAVKRGQTENITVALKKNPTLHAAESPPEETEKKKELPASLEEKEIIAPTWDPSERQLVFWDPEDEKVKLWKKDNLKQLTVLKNMKTGLRWYWSPDSNQLVGLMGSAIYFIDVNKASRKKILSPFPPQNITWSPESSYLLINNQKKEVFKIKTTEKIIEPTDEVIDLNNAVWESENTLIYFIYDEENNESLIQSFNTSSGEIKTIIKKTEFKIEKALVKEGKMIYFYSPAENRWYQLTY